MSENSKASSSMTAGNLRDSHTAGNNSSASGLTIWSPQQGLRARREAALRLPPNEQGVRDSWLLQRIATRCKHGARLCKISTDYSKVYWDCPQYICESQVER
jgi:hypothetical protein